MLYRNSTDIFADTFADSFGRHTSFMYQMYFKVCAECWPCDLLLEPALENVDGLHSLHIYPATKP